MFMMINKNHKGFTKNPTFTLCSRYSFVSSNPQQKLVKILQYNVSRLNFLFRVSCLCLPQEVPTGKSDGDDKDLDGDDNRDPNTTAPRIENGLLTDLDRTSCTDNAITRELNSPMIKET